MKQVTRVFAATMLFGLVSLNANAAEVVLDFEGFSQGTFSSPIAEDGFWIDPALAPFLPAINDFGAGNEVIFCGWCNNGFEGVSIYSQGGYTFELDSIDFISNGLFFPGTVTGYLQGGGTVSQNVDGVIGVVNFDSSWVNLTSIDIVFEVSGNSPFGTVPGIDDVTLQAVPVPAAIWLFGSAMGLLGWLRKR